MTNRAKFWEELSEIKMQQKSAWLLTGDFNELLDNSEKVGGPLRWEGSFLSFWNFVSQNGLWDLQFSSNSLSLRGTRYTHFIQSRVHGVMENVEWLEMFPAARSEYLRFEGSDHWPVLTHFGLNLKKKIGVFWYDQRLKNKPEVREIVEQTWNQSTTDILVTKFYHISRNLVEWVKTQGTTRKECIISNQQLLEQALSAPHSNQDRIEELK